MLHALFCFEPARADYDASQAWFRSQSVEDRLFVQFCLMFTDDYVALADGLFGRRTYEALVRFQNRNGLFPDGALDGDEFALLVAQAAELFSVVGFSFENDARTGLTIGVPLALLPFTSATERGTRWASGDGSVELETIRMPFYEVPFEELYERLTVEKSSRDITYSTIKSDFFVVSGFNRGKLFYSRFQRAAYDSRGFSLAWSPQYDSVFSRLSIAISNSLAIEIDRYELPQPAPPASPPESAVSTSPPTSNPSLASGTGFFVSSLGHIATNAHVVEDCRSIEVTGYGRATVVRSDPVNDLALVKVTRAGTTPLSLRNRPARLGEDIVVLGFPLSDILADTLTVTAGNISSLSGILGDSRAVQISAGVQPGNSGGPLLDRFGSVLGVVSSRLDDAAAIELSGSIPQNVNFAIKSTLLDGFLQSAGLEASYAEASESDELSISDVAEIGEAATVQIVCRGLS
jgi:S1-C subfamily serine protease